MSKFALVVVAAVSIASAHNASAAEGAPCGQSVDYFKPDPMNPTRIMHRHNYVMEANWFLSNVYSPVDQHTNFLNNYTYEHMGTVGYWHDDCEV